MSLRNCLFCGKLSKKTYATERSRSLMKGHARTLKEKDNSEKTSSFSGLQTNFSVSNNLSFSYFANYLFELKMNWTYFDFILVVHHFINSFIKLILKFIILWNFCVLLCCTVFVISELTSSWTRLEEKFHICSLIHYFAQWKHLQINLLVLG